MSTNATPATPATAAKEPRQIVPFKYLVTTNENLRKEFLDYTQANGVDASAEKFNVSPATVYSVLRVLKAYVPTKRPVYDNSPEKLAKAAEMLKAGRRATTVAKELGLATSMVYGVAKDQNITLQKGIEAAPIPAETLSKIEAELKAGHSAKSVSTTHGVAYVKILDMAAKWGIKLERKGKGARGIFSRPQS